jgi:hypothetical protein
LDLRGISGKEIKNRPNLMNHLIGYLLLNSNSGKYSLAGGVRKSRKKKLNFIPSRN